MDRFKVFTCEHCMFTPEIFSDSLRYFSSYLFFSFFLCFLSKNLSEICPIVDCRLNSWPQNKCFFYPSTFIEICINNFDSTSENWFFSVVQFIQSTGRKMLTTIRLFLVDFSPSVMFIRENCLKDL